MQVAIPALLNYAGPPSPSPEPGEATIFPQNEGLDAMIAVLLPQITGTEGNGTINSSPAGPVTILRCGVGLRELSSLTTAFRSKEG